jgi:FkbM family methyltransferase
MKTPANDRSTVEQPNPLSIPPYAAPGTRSLRYRKLFDIATEKLYAFINRHRPKISWVSQCGQDAFIIEKIYNRKREGFFLEIGGGDGLYLSNTIVLETYFEWRGILVEPTTAFNAMVKNRPKAKCEHVAIAGNRKTVRLFEILDKGQAAMNPEAAGDNTLLSVIEEPNVIEPVSRVPEWATVKTSYLVEAITLDDLLTKHGAPSTIDYFSFDVEGAEYEILKDFPFTKWKFNCIGVETPSAELDKLLVSNKYLLIKVGKLDSFYLHRDFFDEWLES